MAKRPTWSTSAFRQQQRVATQVRKVCSQSLRQAQLGVEGMVPADSRTIGVIIAFGQGSPGCPQRQRLLARPYAAVHNAFNLATPPGDFG
jgi:hypothetical protein